ncbi:MAG: hypothetical protein K1Y36_07425 [Blastocatellia bacterium]|nr:hypothetical protein [Blastocatellia bacterium]
MRFAICDLQIEPTQMAMCIFQYGLPLDNVSPKNNCFPNGKWQMANGKWQMANGKWQMANA